MRRKNLWLLGSAVLILAMLLTACGSEQTATTTTSATTAATTTSTTAATITATTTQVTTTTTTTAAGMPKYGGTLTVALAADLASYDSWSTNPHSFARMIYDPSIAGNIETPKDEWPAYGMYWPKKYQTGCLIESWEEIGTDTVIMHVRQGIHFQNLSPVNGRELTADDVVYGYTRSMSPKSSVATSQNLTLFCVSITALDTYTVEYKFRPDQVNNSGGWSSSFHKSNTWALPQEVVDKYNNSLANPIGQVGTGPYIIKDYVPGSSFTCTRNPDYWGTDPRYPGNKLPYIDIVVHTVIPDLSTRLAALRTGKIARLGSIPIDQQANLIQTSPELRYRRILTEGSQLISLRNDIPPFKDVRVRQALSMAIDRHAIVDQYYQGYAQYSNFRVPTHWPEYIPLEQFPEDIQKIFNYHPDEAKQLLADAGYPNGFQTEIIIPSTSTSAIDVMQLVKAWWLEDLNVDLNIRVLDSASALSLQQKHSYPQMYMSGSGISYPANNFSYFYQPDNTFRVYNTSEVHDPVYNAKYEAFMASWDLSKAEQDALWYDMIEYTRQQSNAVELPSPDTFLFWQPWLKGHWGQAALTFTSSGDLYKYLWIDKD